MKYFVFYCVLLVVTCSSCSRDSWSEADKDEFLKICFSEGGSKNYCNCFLDKMMEFKPIAEEVDQMNFEQKVELAAYCD